jgi:ATP-dependent Clp protease adapter protein ClpS
MEQNSHLSREQEIEAVMGVFGVDKRTADVLVAREHNQGAGECVAVTKDGGEIPSRRALRLKKKKPAA